MNGSKINLNILIVSLMKLNFDGVIEYFIGFLTNFEKN